MLTPNIFLNLWLRFPLALLSMRLVVVAISFTIHELAHGLAAAALGDPTPREAGRLTLNPARHWEHIGLIGGVLIGVGWSRRTPISPHRMRVPDWIGGPLAVLAGPLATVGIVALCQWIFAATPLEPSIPWQGWPTLADFVTVMVRFNLFYALLNILPLFPLDMWQLIRFVLPLKTSAWWERRSGWTTTALGFAFFVLLMAPPVLFIRMTGQPARWALRVFLGWDY